jgi:hypothetical protein
MRSRVGFALAVVLLLVVTGCSPRSGATAPAGVATATPTLDASATQQPAADGFESILGRAFVAIDSEPSGDVSDGTYMAWVESVTSGGPGWTASVDFVSNDAPTGTDWHTGTNKYKHPQVIPIAPDGALVVPERDGRLRTVIPAEFSRVWASDPGYRTTPYYVIVGAGEVLAMWPVPFP